MSTKTAYVLKTTPTLLADWAKTPFARKQSRTAAALAALAPGNQRSLRRAQAALGAIVTAPVRFSENFERDPSAALALVVLDRALGRDPMPEIDALVDAAFTRHGGDPVALAAALFRRLTAFSELLWRIHDGLPLPDGEERLSRRAAEDADYEMHGSFVNSCVAAAELLGDYLDKENPT